MRFKTLDDIDVKDKFVLVRSDLNSEIIKGKPQMSERISESAKTISELKRKGAKVVILAHQGRPGEKDFMGLEQHSKLLSRFTEVTFVDDVCGMNAVKAITSLEKGQAILLDNVRKIRGEFEPDKRGELFLLHKHFDFYVNDAFSVSHRRQTSVVSFPTVLKSVVGRVMEKEIRALEKLKIKDCLFILGGSKIEEVVLLSGRKQVISGGLFSLACMYSRGFRFGKNDKILASILGKFPRLKSLTSDVGTPIDFALDVSGKRKEVNLDDFPSRYLVYDIGENTVEKYCAAIKSAKAIFIKGPMGFSEKKNFSFGTKKILEAVSKSNAFSVIGGGHTISVMKRLKFKRSDFGYASLSGGALVEFVAGKKLPGLEVLK